MSDARENGAGLGPGTVAVSAAQAIKDASRKVLPKRFYTAATSTRQADGSYALELDGRTAKTPAKRLLRVPTKRLGETLLAEWSAQALEINPATMPLTTLAVTAIDSVTGKEADVVAEIGRYALSDLLCYRAEAPQELIARQKAFWDGPLAWAAGRFGHPLKTTTGVMPITQAPEIATRIEQRLVAASAIEIAALSVATTISGSAVLALALRERHLDFTHFWAAAHVDEDWQIAVWGTDDEAQARRAHRKLACETASSVLSEVVS